MQMRQAHPAHHETDIETLFISYAEYADNFSIPKRHAMCGCHAGQLPQKITPLAFALIAMLPGSPESSQSMTVLLLLREHDRVRIL